jgi:hypothetical protein
VAEEGVAQIITIMMPVTTVMGEMAAKSVVRRLGQLLHLLEETAAITIVSISHPGKTVVMAGMVETSAAKVSVLEEKEAMGMGVIYFAAPMVVEEVW